jgi:general secretion pathway protein B
MSFILEALRKSEQERQRQAGPGFAELRPAMARPVFPTWAVALGALLAVNLVVLVVVMMRRDDTRIPVSPPATAAGSAPVPYTAAPPGTPPLAAPVPLRTEMPTEDLYAGAPEKQPATRSPRVAAAVPVQEAAEAEPELQPPPRASESQDDRDAQLPSINDMALQGVTLPELHLDIHVYATEPAERFVFLNNRKYREGGETPEGTKIERITRDGVVLNHRGVRFLLPRQ